MWFQVFTFYLSYFAFSQAQDQASFVRSNDPTGRCHYTFTVAGPDRSSCTGSITKAEVKGILTRISLLEALVGRLIEDVDEGAETGLHPNETGGLQEAYYQVSQEKNQLQVDKKHLSKQVQEQQRRLNELNMELENLKQRTCQQTHTSGAALDEKRPTGDLAHNAEDGAYQEMKAEVTQVPASHLITDGNHTVTLSDCLTSGCGELLSVGDPVMLRKADTIMGKYGVWLQDPEPQGSFYTNETVWRIDAVGKDVRQFFAYEDMDQFTRGFPMKVLVLPEPVESTGATIYKGSLYYQLRRSRTLIRYNLTSETVAAHVELPYAGFHGQYPYSWGGYTDIDFAADEQGLWVIYSTSKAKGAIVISQLDPKSLEVMRSWETNIRKNTVANAFMMCGRLYTVASYTAANTSINYMFDTSTGEGRTVSVSLKNKYRYNSMVDYNHALRKLYAWDNFHMVTYSLRLGGASNGSS
ncbi:myocilin-like [Gouania willdenowi]|uniref:myocilin-like n=1 Tax=Gouania willdenowi TaxID=441366 RepID=UPI001055CBE5|nr:myocilin-like [Gouania willdenowi]